ncbi:MAG: hypothetical protein KGL52_03795 [Rhodospirillales bacterium]|jgi:ElaB/YqjD/DUF883 family membrane-anchored ribosome-binding protein|nr:hypothetical protein [Rhodospirillales bacterium]
MSDADKAAHPSEDTREQIARLRAQVDALMRDRVEPAVSHMAERAEHAMGAVRGQADTVSAQIRAQPFISVLVAAAVGFVIGRTLR